MTIEFPHLLRLLEGGQFDTIYHEHFSYFSLLSARRILAAHGLAVVDVEELPTHGGSLRLHVRHAELGATPAPALELLEASERAARLDDPVGYADLAPRVEAAKRDILAFLIDARRAGGLLREGFDTDAFVELVEQVHDRPNDPSHTAAVRLQQLEWQELFGACARAAVGVGELGI